MSINSAEIPSGGSSLLRESLPFRGSPHTGPGGADLSLSELYLSDRSEDVTQSKPFSLLPQYDTNEEMDQYDNEQATSTDEDVKKAEADEGDVTILQKGPSSSSVAREERLQHDLFVLKKLNSSFSLYNEALKDTRSSTENVALQLKRTDQLLDQYVNLLQHTEKNSKLIFDEFWEGGGTDQNILEKLHAEAIQNAEREREGRERAAQMEQERQEREEQERKAKAEREARERDRKGSASVKGVRGVRGLRARGADRGSSNVARGRLPSAPAAQSRGSTISRGIRKS